MKFKVGDSILDLYSAYKNKDYGIIIRVIDDCYLIYWTMYCRGHLLRYKISTIDEGCILVKDNKEIKELLDEVMVLNI